MLSRFSGLFAKSDLLIDPLLNEGYRFKSWHAANTTFAQPALALHRCPRIALEVDFDAYPSLSERTITWHYGTRKAGNSIMQLIIRLHPIAVEAPVQVVPAGILTKLRSQP
jgi:hypothetical protein